MNNVRWLSPKNKSRRLHTNKIEKPNAPMTPNQHRNIFEACCFCDFAPRETLLKVSSELSAQSMYPNMPTRTHTPHAPRNTCILVGRAAHTLALAKPILVLAVAAALTRRATKRAGTLDESLAVWP